MLSVVFHANAAWRSVQAVVSKGRRVTLAQLFRHPMFSVTTLATAVSGALLR
jgi:hypothetical protein